MSKLSKRTEYLILEYQKSYRLSESKETTPLIHVDEIASRVASFYEKVRGIIDWKEEHLLKRGAIERTLRRRILPQININNKEFIKGQVLAEPFVLELIRSGHFPNDKIEEVKIETVQKVIDKYVFILNNAQTKDSKINLYQWISSIAACEIEEILSPSIKEMALMEHMYNEMKERIKLSDDIIKKEKVSEEEKNIQIFINIKKALFDLDVAIISYHLIKYKYPRWPHLSEKELFIIADGIDEIRSDIDNDLNHPLEGKINNICQKYNTPYFILDDIISDDPIKATEKISDPQKFESLIKQKYEARLKSLRIKIKRAAFYSTISIFLTDVMFFFAIEIPLTKFFGQFSIISYIVNIFIPATLMALLVITIKSPPKENLEKVIIETIKLTYENEKKETYNIKRFKKKGPIFNFVLAIIYTISTVVSVGTIIFILNKINFPPFSSFIFIIFLSLIAFAGTKIRQKGRILHMVEEKETFVNLVIDFFAFPIILLGKWLTVKWKRYNIFSIIFNALIDMPYSVFVEFIEQWRYFLKEKKERL